jgi:hypothetical protein
MAASRARLDEHNERSGTLKEADSEAPARYRTWRSTAHKGGLR